ncbi:hypothetical protein TorRG33x02_321250 [Trema orientale]|uniref:Uncharacterized protein n=1 Tax=Trema orientale TaxID=63057 RepID=A0A2P5BH51_TREOI|nr:hypothetical protein TorRG33x02_321250 [Trema orientale]
MGLLDGGEEIITYNDMDVNLVRDEIVGADGRVIVIDLVDDLQKIPKKNWASFTIEFLMNAVSSFKGRLTKYLPGCTIFLELIYFYNVDWHFGYVDRSVLALIFWFATNVRRVVRYIRKLDGYDSVKLRKVYTTISHTTSAIEAQRTVARASPSGPAVLSDGSQCCTCGYKAKVSRMKDEIVNEVRRVMNESIDVYHTNLTDIVKAELENVKNEILKDFWNAALIRKDPLQTIEDMSHDGEEDSGWEDEDIKEESDDGDDEDEDNKEFHCK